MIPVISFIGRSGSGKTSLLEKVVAELKKRCVKVAVIKHSHHENFEFDKNGDFLHISTGEDAYETVGREPFYGDEHIANRMFFTQNGVIQDT